MQQNLIPRYDPGWAWALAYDAVDGLRSDVVDAALDILVQPRDRLAVLAADLLQSALRYPMSMMGLRIRDTTLDKYTAEFIATLTRIKDMMTGNRLSPVATIAVASAISWHAGYGNPKTMPIAKAIMAAVPRTLDLRVLSALADGFGQTFVGKMEAHTWQARLNKWIGDISATLSAEMPDAGALRRYLEDALIRVCESGLAKETSTHVFIHEMLRIRPDLSQELVETAIQNADARMTVYLGAALFFYQDRDHAAGLTWARRLLDTGDARLQAAVATAFNNPPTPTGALAPEDLEIAVRVLGSEHKNVVVRALGILHAKSQHSPRLALDLLRHVNFHADHSIIDHAFMMFHGEASSMFSQMNEDDASFILSRLAPVPELTGHWIETLLAHLSFYYPEITCRFFLNRVELAATEETFSRIRPINHGAWVHIPLRFRESDRFRGALEEVWDWMVGHPGGGDWRFEHNAAAVFETMFLPVDDVVIAFLESKIDVADKNALRWVSNILANAETDLVFRQTPFVIHFLEVCERADGTMRDKAVESLFRSTLSGVRSGTLGDPFPRDVEFSAKATEVMDRLPRISPAYELYRMIRDHADLSIARQKSDAEYFRG